MPRTLTISDALWSDLVSMGNRTGNDPLYVLSAAVGSYEWAIQKKGAGREVCSFLRHPDGTVEIEKCDLPGLEKVITTAERKTFVDRFITPLVNGEPPKMSR